MSLTFLTSGIITASAITIQENKVGEQKETTPLTKTVILYRHGIDGSVTPFEVNLNLEDGQDIGKVMADKCEELLENDEEIQKFLALSDYKLGVLCKVKSHGRGTHYQTVLLGKLVARLKGGDPLIFGRGSEEALELVKNGIEFEVVPGVTAGIAASAYAGISLTHRGYSSTVAFITGHEDPNKQESDINWSKISTGIGTLVFFMGVKNLPLIVSKLKEFG